MTWRVCGPGGLCAKREGLSTRPPGGPSPRPRLTFLSAVRYTRCPSFTGDSMLFTRELIEEREAKTLVPYAHRSRDSRGREVPEEEPRYRPAYARGHPPFGHSGEVSLRALMGEHGGFDHNRQSLRIVTQLERRYPNFEGLNLTWEVREGIVKHETEYDVADAQGYEPELRGHLEAQIANVADELAYTAHDLDDGMRSVLISPAELEGLELWERTRV